MNFGFVQSKYRVLFIYVCSFVTIRTISRWTHSENHELWECPGPVRDVILDRRFNSAKVWSHTLQDKYGIVAKSHFALYVCCNPAIHLPSKQKFITVHDQHQHRSKISASVMQPIHLFQEELNVCKIWPGFSGKSSRQYPGAPPSAGTDKPLSSPRRGIPFCCQPAAYALMSALPSKVSADSSISTSGSGISGNGCRKDGPDFFKACEGYGWTAIISSSLIFSSFWGAFQSKDLLFLCSLYWSSWSPKGSAKLLNW